MKHNPPGGIKDVRILALGLWLLFILIRYYLKQVFPRTFDKSKRKMLKQRKKKGLLAYAELRHQYGFSAGEGRLCELFLYPDCLEVRSSNWSVAVPMYRITDVQIHEAEKSKRSFSLSDLYEERPYDAPMYLIFYTKKREGADVIQFQVWNSGIQLQDAKKMVRAYHKLYKKH